MIGSMAFKEIEVPSEAFKNRKDVSNPCCMCGRQVNPNTERFVHMTTNGSFTTAPRVEDIDNSQGFFPIGSECKKLFPKEFIFISH